MDNPQFVANAIQFIKDTITSNTITLQPREPWQPSVMLLSDFEKEWVSYFNHSFMAFLRDHECKTADAKFSISMKKMQVKEYSHDVRLSRQLFAPIPSDLHDFRELLVYFPPEYTLNALEVDVKDYFPVQNDPKIATTINTIGQQLGTFLHKNFPDYYFEILPIGSRSYGAYSPSTDFNYCIVMDDPDLDWIVRNRQSEDKHAISAHPCESEQLAKRLANNPTFKKGSYDPDFNTVRYHDVLGHVQIVFNKRIYTESTDLINLYISLDDRVGQLLSVVKNFVQHRNATKGGLHGGGFYQYCLMTLAYLQQLDPPIIPNLQHLGFGNTDCCRVIGCRTNRKYWDIALNKKEYVGGVAYYHTCVSRNTTLPPTRNFVQQDGIGRYYWNSSNTAKISELVLGFFYYYGYQFNYKKNGISLKNGGIIEKLQNEAYFYIEDPFLTGVNVADANKIGRGISFFLGAFIIIYNEERSYNEALRYSGLLKIPTSERLVTTKVPFQPLSRRRMAHADAVCFLLIGLPKPNVLNAECLCNEIELRYRDLGKLLHIETLDSTTKRVYIALKNPVDGRVLQLSTPVEFHGKNVHVAKLYGFNVTS